MIERELFLSLDFPVFASKQDVYRFESGRKSLTRQVLAIGLKPVVVGRDGVVYEISEWRLLQHSGPTNKTTSWLRTIARVITRRRNSFSAEDWRTRLGFIRGHGLPGRSIVGWGWGWSG